MRQGLLIPVLAAFASGTTLQSCGPLESGEVTFSMTGIKFISQIYTIANGPGVQQMHIILDNAASGISTLCELENFLVLGEWSDNGNIWHDCQDQTIVGGNNENFTVETSAKFDWNSFFISVNQTWTCEGASAPSSAYGSFDTQLDRSCQSIVNNIENITECTSSDVSIPGAVTLL